MEEIDIWRAAELLIQQHGSQAVIEAAKNQVVWAGRGDHEGAAVWGKVILAIDRLMRTATPAGEPRH